MKDAIAELDGLIELIESGASEYLVATYVRKWGLGNIAEDCLNDACDIQFVIFEHLKPEYQLRIVESAKEYARCYE